MSPRMLPAPHLQTLAGQGIGGKGGLPRFLLFHTQEKVWGKRVGKDKHTGAPNLHEVLLSKCCLWKATPTAQVQVQRQSH